MPQALVKMQRKGQMVIPRALREAIGVSEGALMKVSVVTGRQLLVSPQVTIDRAIVDSPPQDSQGNSARIVSGSGGATSECNGKRSRPLAHERVQSRSRGRTAQS